MRDMAEIAKRKYPEMTQTISSFGMHPDCNVES
jgi:hypothetical protein